MSVWSAFSIAIAFAVVAVVLGAVNLWSRHWAVFYGSLLVLIGVVYWLARLQYEPPLTFIPPLGGVAVLVFYAIRDLRARRRA